MNIDVEWRAIPGYEGLYECSENGAIYSLITKRVMKPSKSGRYLHICLCKEGNRKTHSIHRLVSTTFLGECPLGLQINHKDGDRMNNNYTNLEYITPKRNTEHAIEIGLRNNAGENNGRSVLSNADIPEIRRLLAAGDLTQEQIAIKYGVISQTISQIRCGEIWNCVEDGSDLDLGYRPRPLDRVKVRKIKQLLKSGNYSQREIGEMFNVAQTMISHIKLGKSWRNLE